MSPTLCRYFEGKDISVYLTLRPLQTPEPKPHPNTVATLLKILIEKGFVQTEVQGRNNFYRPKISKAEYGGKSANQLLKGYFEGSPTKLISQFVTANKLIVK